MDLRRRLRSLYRRITNSDDHHFTLAPAIAAVRWTVLFYKQLQNDRAFVRAAGMAYATLVSLVPLLMLVFGLLHAFGVFATDPVTGQLDTRPFERLVFGTFLADVPEVREVVMAGLVQIDLTTLGIVGVGSLVVIAGRLYMMIERAYNDIYGVTVNRGFGYRVLNFYFTITALPAMAVFGVVAVEELGFAHPLKSGWILVVMQFMVLLIALKAFPCTKVEWRPAILGAAVSALLVNLGGGLFPLYVRWFASDDPLRVVYGSLALVPVFLLWLYLLWIFVLLGVEIAHVGQNFTSLVQAERDHIRRSEAIFRSPSVETAIDVAVHVAWCFEMGVGPVTLEELARIVKVPSRELLSVLRVLEKEGLLASSDRGWLPARPANQIELTEVMEVWRGATTLRRDEGEDLVGDEIGRVLRGAIRGNLRDSFARFVHQTPAEDEAAAILG